MGFLQAILGSEFKPGKVCSELTTLDRIPMSSAFF